jgi:hypothetical protein
LKRGWKVGLRAALPASVALLAALVASGMTPGGAGSARSSRATAHSTTLSVSVSTPVKVHGLLAEQVFVVSNLGAADAHRVQAHIRFAPSITVQRVVSPQGTCTVAAPAGVDCRLGTVRAGAAIAFKARYRLTYVPPKANNVIRASAGNAVAVATSGPSYFMDRYWLCGCSTVYSYPNGWTVPATDQGVSVGPDDTVRLPGGYYISPDGVLHFPDGRMIKDTLTAELFIPRKS